MAIDKLTPRALTLDKDPKITAPVDFTYANNLRVTVDANGDGGVIKNILSDAAIALDESMPLGSNTVIGCYAFELINTLFFFISNSESNHTIWRYVTSETTAQKVIESSYLNFRADDFYYVDGVLFNNEPYLYMTNGRNEPIKINVNSALSTPGYPVSINDISVAKRPPLAPYAEFATHSDHGGHSLIGESFQFAAQYVYRDGEESAIGHYSPLYASPNTLNETIASHAWELEYNSLLVSVEPLDSSVEKVRLYFRNNSSAPFYFIEEKDHTGSVVEFDFHNDKIYPVHPDVESNKMFDAVPRSASAQAYIGGRIVYGNYKEGFDVPAQSATITPVYYDAPGLNNLDVEVLPTHASNRMVIRVNIGDLPENGDAGTFILNAALNKAGVTLNQPQTAVITFKNGTTATDTVTPKFETEKYTINQYAEYNQYLSKSDFASQINNSIAGTEIEIPVFTQNNYVEHIDLVQYNIYYGGSSVWEIESVTYVTPAVGFPFNLSTVLEFRLKLVSAELASHLIQIDSSGLDAVGATSFLSIDNSADATMTGTFALIDSSGVSDVICYTSNEMGSRAFKSGESHTFGVVFEDYFGRQSGVQEIGATYVEWTGSPKRIGKNGKAAIKIDLTSLMPSWANRFFFVYGGGDNYVNYIQYAVTEAFHYVQGSPKVILSLRGLQGNDRSLQKAKGAAINYSFSEGDKVRVVSYVSTDGNIVYPYNLEFDVVDFIKTTDPSELPTVASGGNTSDQNERTSGDFVVIDARNITDFGWSYVNDDVDLWANECVVELFNDGKKTSQNSAYYACSPSYPRTEYTNVFTLTDGNCWYKPRLIRGFQWDSSNPYTPADSAEMEDYVKFVEAEEYTDYDSDAKYYTKGKVNAVIYNEKENNQFASITWSEPLNTDSSSLVLSSFNNSLANWFDFEMSQGNIQGIANKSDFALIMQKDGIAITKPNTDFLQSGDNQLVSINNNFISGYAYFDSKIGLQYRGSFSSVEGAVIGLDVYRGMLWSAGNNGIKIISENGMSKYFADYCREISDRDQRGSGDVITVLEPGAEITNITIGYDRRNKEVLINRIDLTSVIIPSGGSETVYGWSKDYSNPSIVYNTKEEVFTSFRDLCADGFGSINNRFFAVRASGGSYIWEQEVGPTYGNLIGTKYNMSFDCVSSKGVSSVKAYNAVSIEGNKPASCVFTTEKQTASLNSARFSEKENSFFSGMPTASGTTEYTTVGKVNSVSGNNVTFYNFVNRIPFRVGGDAYLLSGTALSSLSSTIDSIESAKTLSFSDASGVSQNNIIVVKSDSSIDGDAIRGHWLETKFTFENGDEQYPTKIYAVNFNYAQSDIHHVSQE
jgi:hypothetical protein